jgi:hypothetical protein
MLDFNTPDENDPAGCSQCGRYECDCDAEVMAEEELEVCPYCGRFECVCDTADDTEEDRYLDKRLTDREDFHSDDARFPSFNDEPYYPDY